MTNVRLDLSFPHRFEVEVAEELPPAPASINHVYFPLATEGGGKDGITVKVSPYEGQPWLGTFAFRDDSQQASTGVFSHPDDLSLCVVSRGQGYIVRADEPRVWSLIQTCYPIFDVRAVPEARLLLFADLTAISAYGPKGVVWTTPRLSWDGLKITHVTSTHIKGLAWDSPQNREVEFIVDLKTGQHQGGSSPEKYAAM
ncbi:MAG: hypothetical protein ICV60_18800 [Pyrinomonadaceae bacterium]|nr:hypothetical protein [Pyrinomonadaceae bacterium]